MQYTPDNVSTTEAPGAAGSMDMFLFWKTNQSSGSNKGEEAVDHAAESITSSPLTDLLLLAALVIVSVFATYCVTWYTMKFAKDDEEISTGTS